MELTTSKMAAGGDAIAREPGGRVVFVEGALPGERVRVQLTQQRKDFAHGRVIEVIEPSPDRLSEAGECGGCSWSFIELGAQRRLKRDIVADALRRIAKIPEAPLAADVPAPADARRTTVRAGVAADGRAGFRRRHGHDIVVHDCPIVHPDLRLHDDRFEGDEVVVRVSLATGERSVNGEPDALNEDAAGRRWRVSAESFFQPSPDAATLLADVVRGLAHGAVVLDAYAGVGLLGGSLAPDRLVAVESAPSAVDDARVNLADLDALVVEGEVADAVPKLEVKADVVVADPARPGLGRAASTALAGVGPERIVLVSCDPASLARDVMLLDALGYRLTSSQVLDLFPHTFHVEVVSAFDRA